MLGREAKLPTIFHSKISKEGVDFVNKVILMILSFFKEFRENV
jgi:hypothetical protein